MPPEDYGDLEGGGVPDFLRDPVGIPSRHWRWMLLAFVLGLGGSAFMVSQWVPVYQAQASILVTSQQIPEEFIKTTVPEDPFSRLSAMVTQVLSRQKLVSLIDEFGLYGELRQTLPLEEIVAEMRAKITIEGQGGHRPGRDEMLARVYTINFEDESPDRAAEVANRLAALFLEAGIKSRMERADEISRFLRQELQRSDETLREENRAIAQFNERYRGELPSELGTNLQKLDRLQAEKQQLELQIVEAQARINTMPASVDPNSPASRLEALTLRYHAELAVHTPEHPTVMALERQMQALQTQVDAQAGDPRQTGSRMVVSAQTTLATMRAQLARVNREIIELDARVSRTPKHAEELAGLSERAGVSREKYLDFLRKVNAAELAQTLETAQQGSQVTIMDRAFPPREPTRSRARLLLIGLVGTLGATVFAGLFFEFLDPVMVAPDQAEKITGLPELGSVPHLG